MPVVHFYASSVSILPVSVDISGRKSNWGGFKIIVLLISAQKFTWDLPRLERNCFSRYRQAALFPFHFFGYISYFKLIRYLDPVDYESNYLQLFKISTYFVFFSYVFRVGM